MEYIAHRGASGYAPENTMAAFRLARDMGLRSFEFDVHLSKDGVPVVHHDYDLARTAGIKPQIAELSYARLARVNAARNFSPWYPFQQVPAFEQVMEFLSAFASAINIEIKNDGGIYEGIEKIVLDKICLSKSRLEKSIISSFDYPTLLRLRALHSGVRLGLLTRDLSVSRIIYAARAIKAETVNLSSRRVSERKVKLLHKAGFKVFVYTVNTFEEAENFKKMGADAVFTNYPYVSQRGWENIGGTL